MVIIRRKIINCILLFIFITTNSSFGQDIPDFDYEYDSDITVSKNTNYSISIDSTIVQNGRRSILIEYTGDTIGFKFASYSIPAKYQGKKVKLSGYLKTENVSEGWAGLVLRIDPKVYFNNRQGEGVTGTTDWTYIEIETDLKQNLATKFVVGGLLVGKGKVWVDNLSLTIDGVSIGSAPLRELTAIEKDNEFDLGSNLVLQNLDNKNFKDLALLGQIWGFLKYHHPKIAKGKYNWDYELFRIIPKYVKAKNDLVRDSLLINWIDSFGEIQKCNSCKEVSQNAIQKPDFSWLPNNNASKKLKSRIEHIRENRNQGENYSVSITRIGNPSFENERPYSNMAFPDDGFRLLAIFRYWNIIHYFFPYKYLIDEGWPNVLSKYIQDFIEAKSELEYETVVLKLLGEVHDTHAKLISGDDMLQKKKGDYFAAFHLKFVENQLIVDDYYNENLDSTSLKIGDIITHVDNESINKIIQERKGYYPASNLASFLRDVSLEILRSQRQEVQIEYIRDNVKKSQKLTLYKTEELNFAKWYNKGKGDSETVKIIDGKIGYIDLKTIHNEQVEKIKDTLRNTKGVIIDIRNYPSAFVPFTLAPFFVSDSTEFVKFTNADLNSPGEFNFTDALRLPGSKNNYQGKVVILVNEMTQSMAEYTTMAFQAGKNTVVLGSETAGADGNVSRFHLPGGLLTQISGIGVYYPDGTETQRVGIVPDVVIKPTIRAIKNGKDELLAKAIELINRTN